MTTAGNASLPLRGRVRNGTGASGPVRKALGPDLIIELEKLCGKPSIGLLDICKDLAAIVIAAAAGILIGHVGGPLLAAVYIGVRQRHLSNLAHECVHGKLLATRTGNRLLGHLLTGLLGEGFVPYRSSHAIHHAKLGSAADPMFQSYRGGNLLAAGPTPTRRSFVFHVIVRNALWRLPRNAVITLLRKEADERWTSYCVRAGLWMTVAAACWTADALGSLVTYWLLPLILVRPVVTWITDLGNHAGLIENTDPLMQTRGWSSHWFTRHLLGGHLDDMYHPLHHWCPQVPWRRLPQARTLAEQHLDRWPQVPWCSGYFFRRRATPGQPCVIEDIIARLHARPADTAA